MSHRNNTDPSSELLPRFIRNGGDFGSRLRSFADGLGRLTADGLGRLTESVRRDALELLTQPDLRAAGDLVLADKTGEFLGLLGKVVNCRCRLLDHPRIGLRHPIHLADRLVHLFKSGRLFLHARGNAADDLGDFEHPGDDALQSLAGARDERGALPNSFLRRPKSAP